MTWTTTPPTEPGYYCVRGGNSPWPASIVELAAKPDGTVLYPVFDMGRLGSRSVDGMSWEWAGPLVPPG